MENVIFIDANIFLRFFDSKSSNFKLLLKTIEEVNGNIFITKQIVDEINRNKLNVFLKSFNEYIKQYGMNEISLPEHLGTIANVELKEWNENTTKLQKSSKDQLKKLNTITIKLINSISENQDDVSQTFNRSFINPKINTDDQLFRARLRKELGNPPGKREDPIGDQLSWEQLLDEVSTIKNLWIISNDTDYILEFDKKCFLNPLLINDIKSKNSNINLFLFNTLSEGLRSFIAFSTTTDATTTEEPAAITQTTTLPPQNILNIIKDEEKQSNIIDTYTSGSTNDGAFIKAINFYLGSLIKQCPLCGKTANRTNRVNDHMLHDGEKHNFYCDNCKMYFD